MTTLCEAKKIIEQAKAARPTCDRCDSVAYDSAAVPSVMYEAGYEHALDRACWQRRCETCRSTPKFSWANRLDAERVASYLRSKPKRFIWPLEELKALVEP